MCCDTLSMNYTLFKKRYEYIWRIKDEFRLHPFMTEWSSCGHYYLNIEMRKEMFCGKKDECFCGCVHYYKHPFINDYFYGSIFGESKNKHEMAQIIEPNTTNEIIIDCASLLMFLICKKKTKNKTKTKKYIYNKHKKYSFVSNF